MEISETIIVAAITFASSFIGALFGLIGVSITSRRTAKAQMQQIIIQETFQARQKAFAEIFISENELLAAVTDKDACTEALKRFNHCVAFNSFVRLLVSSQ